MRAVVIVIGLAAAVAVAAQDTRAAASRQQTKTPPAPVTKVPPGAANTRGRAAVTVPPDTARQAVATIMREVYDYESGGRRDPFVSLLMSPELRPTVADLRLVGVLYDESGRRPVAIMRDVQTNTQYRVTTGMSLGRLRVALIKRRAVIFNIEEFGLNRQDSLVLGDSSKVGAR